MENLLLELRVLVHAVLFALFVVVATMAANVAIDMRFHPFCPECGSRMHTSRMNFFNKRAQCALHGTFIPPRGYPKR